MNYCVQQIFLLFSDVPSEPQITNLTTVMEIGKPTTVGCVINQVHRLQNGLFMVYISHALKTQNSNILTSCNLNHIWWNAVLWNSSFNICINNQFSRSRFCLISWRSVVLKVPIQLPTSHGSGIKHLLWLMEQVKWNVVEVIVLSIICHHLLTLRSFQICMTKEKETAF